MNLTYEPISLNLRTPFRIAHGSSTTRHNVIVRISDGHHVGLGEAAPVRQHCETQEGVMDYLSNISLPQDPFAVEDILTQLPAGSQAARAAIDIALHDLLGKNLGVPLYRLWGLNPVRAPQTSFTLGIGTVHETGAKARAAGQEFNLLKLKFDSDTDHALAATRAVREAAASVRLVADANCAWSVAQAEEVIPALAELGLEWIEQPLPEEDLKGLRHLRHTSPIPIFADEPVRTARDIARLAGCVDGVNIKIMKAGGLAEARRMISVARAHDMQVMLGCMVETSVGITAASHLAPLVDWVDLDGILLINNDPFQGVRIEKGRLSLPQGPGLGVVPRQTTPA